MPRARIHARSRNILPWPGMMAASGGLPAIRWHDPGPKPPGPPRSWLISPQAVWRPVSDQAKLSLSHGADIRHAFRGVFFDIHPEKAVLQHGVWANPGMSPAAGWAYCARIRTRARRSRGWTGARSGPRTGTPSRRSCVCKGAKAEGRRHAVRPLVRIEAQGDPVAPDTGRIR